MRIITGKARGTRLKAPAGVVTRPTSERAKEAVFSMLQFELREKEVLDLFAGSGQMGLEALSRGASHAVFCDSDREAQAVVRQNATDTKLISQCEFFQGDAFSFLERNCQNRKFDLVFLDPPYAAVVLPKALRMLAQNGLLRPGAKLICESAAPEDVFGADPDLQKQFACLRVSHYGIAFVTVLAYSAEATV